TFPRQFARLGEFVDAKIAAANPYQSYEVDHLLVVEVVDQFAQFRLGWILALVQLFLAILRGIGLLAGFGFIREHLDIEGARFESDVLDFVEADVQVGRLVAVIDHWTSPKDSLSRRTGPA